MKNDTKNKEGADEANPEMGGKMTVRTNSNMRNL
jgi:hypothetical protein